MGAEEVLGFGLLLKVGFTTGLSEGVSVGFGDGLSARLTIGLGVYLGLGAMRFPVITSSPFSTVKSMHAFLQSAAITKLFSEEE